MPLNQHVAGADRPGFGVDLLTVEVQVQAVAGDRFGGVLRLRQHSAGAAGRIVDQIRAALLI